VSGQAVSLIGTWTETVAQALLVLRLSHSGAVLGLMTAARFAPTLLLSPYGGVLADRYPKRRLLAVTQFGLALVSLTLGLLVVTNAVRLWQVAVLATVFGVLAAVDNPGRLSFVGEMVDRQRLRNAVTLNTTMVNLARALGPAIAGVLVVTVGIGACFLVNAASFAAVVLALATLDGSQLHPAAPRAPARGWLRDGLRYASQRPEILAPRLMMTLIGTFTYEFEVTGIRALLATAAGEARFVALSAQKWPLPPVDPESRGQRRRHSAFRGRVTALWSTAYVGSTPPSARPSSARSPSKPDRAGLSHSAPSPAASPS
jgi:MFS family permease